jgi:hypothetical protein
VHETTLVWRQTEGDGAKKSDGIQSVPTPRKSLMGTRWGPSGLQPSMSDLVDWPMDWMELLKFWLSSNIQVALNGEDLARKFAYKWEVKLIFPAPNVKLLLLNGFKDKDICSKRWG